MMCMQRSLDYALQSGYCGNDAEEDDLIHATHGVIWSGGYRGIGVREVQVPRHSSLSEPAVAPHLQP